MNTETITTILLGNVVLLAIAGWLLRTFIINRLTLNRNILVQDLKSKSDAELAQLNSTLNAQVKNLEIYESWLHQQRTEALRDLYHKSINLQSQLNSLFDPIFSPKKPPEIRSLTKKTWDSLQEFRTEYLKMRIFVSEDTCEIIEKLFEATQNSAIEYEVMLGNYDDHELHTLEDVKKRGYQELHENVRPAVALLESECRRIFRVSENSNS